MTRVWLGLPLSCRHAPLELRNMTPTATLTSAGGSRQGRAGRTQTPGKSISIILLILRLRTLSFGPHHTTSHHHITPQWCLTGRELQFSFVSEHTHQALYILHIIISHLSHVFPNKVTALHFWLPSVQLYLRKVMSLSPLSTSLHI